MSDAAQRILSVQQARARELSLTLDIALVEYARRYGNVRFEVSGVQITARGVSFSVTAMQP